MLTATELGRKIEDLRKGGGMTQTQLARLLSVTPQAVGKWERGESMPDLIMFARIAEMFGADLNYFADAVRAENGPAGAAEREQHETKFTAEKKPDFNLSGAVWADADFSELANLGERFSFASISGCRFVGSDLSGLIMRGNTITKNNFSQSDFTKSKIKGSQLTQNDFTGCRFVESIVSGSHLKTCDFTDADFTDAAFPHSHLNKLTVCRAVWTRTSFKGSQLTGIRFDGSLTDCSFVNCDFTGVTFDGATLTNTFFKCKTKKIRFIDCRADRLTYAFIKNGKSDMTGITLLP